MSTVKSFKVDVSSVSALSERMEELWVVCVFICKIAALWGEHENEKTRINQLMKAFVDAVGIKSADLKDKFLF